MAAKQLDFGKRELALLCLVLAFCAFAGRQLFMDGANFVVQSLLDPTWFPQPTPRRFFTVMWSTWPIRLLGRADHTQIELGALFYGLTTYAEIVIPAAVLALSKLEARAKFTLLILFFSAVIFTANFIVGESLFALATTTVFIAYTLDPESDPRGWRRLAAAILTVASYEIVAFSNLLLAWSSWQATKHQSLPKPMRLALTFVPLLALPWQIGWYLYNPNPSAGVAGELFVYAIAAVLLGALLIGVFYFKLTAKFAWLRYGAIALAALAPIAMFFVPQFLGIRTNAFQFAYPSRFYTMIVTCLIAGAPLWLRRDALWGLPARVLGFFREGALRDLGMAVFAAFCGVSVLAGLDAHAFRARMEMEFAKFAGVTPFEQCEFCRDPIKFGAADLGYPGWWRIYSMAYTMHHRDRPAVMIADANESEPLFEPEEIDAFLSEHDRRLVKD